MIGFELSDDQKAFQDLAREFARNEILPVAAEYDRTMEFPRPVLEKAWQTGLMNTHIPESCGGLGLGTLDGCLIAEQLAWGCTGIGTALEANTLAEVPVVVAGTEEQQKKYLGRMMEAPLFAAYAVTEPGAGSDVAAARTSAVKKGDTWVINGQKMWITNGSVANWYFLLAKTDPEADPSYKGMTAFIVEKGNPGFIVSRDIEKCGYKGVETCEIVFEDFRVPAANLIGGSEGEGFKHIMTGLESERINVAARALGIARAAFEDAIHYAQHRVTVGKPICEH